MSEVTNAAGTTITLERPRIDYPAAVYADIPDAIPRLRTIYDCQRRLGRRSTGRRLARLRRPLRRNPRDGPPPAFDRDGTDGGWREVYTTFRAFPDDPAAQLTLTGNFVDVAQLADLDLSGQTGAMGSKSGPLVLPTSRDTKLELRAVGNDDLTYFADERSRRSAPIATELHGIAHDEPNFFRHLDPPQAIRSIFLRNDPPSDGIVTTSIQPQSDPTPILVARLAASAGLVPSETSLVGRPANASCLVAPDSSTVSRLKGHSDVHPRFGARQYLGQCPTRRNQSRLDLEGRP